MAMPPYPPTEPTEQGMLDVGDGHSIYWQVAGNPHGKPAVLLHGGPGGGSADRHRGIFDPAKYRIVQFDQRNCGRSTPSAGQPQVDLTSNTTQALMSDMERLRTQLDIDRWLVWGGSWGTTLGLAYAEDHPERVTELLLTAVVTTSEAEVDWVTRRMRRFFPEEWREFAGAVPEEDREVNLAMAFNRLLMNPDPAVHNPAALAWCKWEDVHVSIPSGYQPDLQEATPAFRLCFSRLVTHYWANAGFLETGQLVRDAHRLEGVPTFMAHGRRDISAPADVPVELGQAIPGAQLFISEDEGHGGPAMVDWMAAIADRLVA